MSNVYHMVITNLAAHIRSQTEEERDGPNRIDAFEASRILAIGFAKLPEDVVMDLVSVDVSPQKAKA